MASIVDNFTKEELIDIVSKSSCMRDVVKKLGYSCNSGSNYSTIRKRLEKYNISTEHFCYKKPQERSRDNIFIYNSTASQATLRRWYLKESDSSRCEICGQNIQWNGKQLTMILDHINGNKKDNRLCNLRWICPNCDSQLDTYAGRNLKNLNRNLYKANNCCIDCGKIISKKAIRCIKCNNKLRIDAIDNSIRKVSNRPNKEDLYNIILQNPNFSNIGNLYGVSDNAIRKWCKDYKIPYHTKDYQMIKNKDIGE